MKATRPCCPTCGKPSTLYGLTAKPLKESEAYQKRIRNLVAQFQLEGYTTREEDVNVSVAAAQIMAVNGESEHMNRLLSIHMERIIASQLIGKEL